MPGPDDTEHFLRCYAAAHGYQIPADIDPSILGPLKAEAEALRNAERGLNALLAHYLGGSSQTAGSAAHATSKSP